jgi:SAM-dependent methyltransferase
MDIRNVYLSGDQLYGDDLGLEEIALWHAEESEAYADLGSRDRNSYVYQYHALNELHGFRHIPLQPLSRVLGFGSAYGEELLPVLDRTSSVTVVDSSDAFQVRDIHGVPADFVKPAVNGELPIPPDHFDLITCFGVLHHIPNVTKNVRELVRVLKPGGYLLVREPVVSMGDWTKPRPGLTKHERGIPIAIMRRIFFDLRLETVRENMCDFALTPRLFRLFRRDVYNSSAVTSVDALLSSMFKWNVRYHATTMFDKLRPTSAFFVLRKPFTK